MDEDYILNSINHFIDDLSNYYSPTLVYLSFFLIIVLLFLPFYIKDVYRPSKIKKIAAKYGLDYKRVDKPYSVKDEFIPDYRENIVEGIIKGKKILIYDRIVHRNWIVVLILGLLWMVKKGTIFSVDGVEKNYFNLWGVASIRKIDSVLSNLAKE